MKIHLKDLVFFLALVSTNAYSSCPTSLNYTFKQLQDHKQQNLCQYSGKVILIVNTASYCGFTSQYEKLENLYHSYRKKGLVILGFPSNNFGHQEPGTNQEIAEFCSKTYGVQFPMFEKSDVIGEHANPLFKLLSLKTGTAPSWNFHKYLIDRKGNIVSSFSSDIAPDSPKFMNQITRLLNQTP